MLLVIFWVVTPCNWRYGGTYRLHLPLFIWRRWWCIPPKRR